MVEPYIGTKTSNALHVLIHNIHQDKLHLKNKTQDRALHAIWKGGRNTVCVGLHLHRLCLEGHPRD